MKESEKLLEQTVNRTVKTLGGWSIKLVPLYIAGLPDRLILMPGGRAYFAEIKTTGQKPRPIQLSIKRKLEAVGFTVFIVDSKEAISNMVNIIMK